MPKTDSKNPVGEERIGAIMKFLKEGRPTLTTMVQATVPERTIDLIKRGLAIGTDAFGIQLERLEKPYRNEENFRRIFDAAEGKPLYITDYQLDRPNRKAERDDELAEELLTALKAGGTLIDVRGDFFDPCGDELTRNPSAIARQKEYIRTIHEKGGLVLMSSHVLQYRKAEDVLEIALAQKERGTDIAKIVTSANSDSELTEALRATVLLREKLGIPFLFLCNGTHCALHRRLGPPLGCSMFLCVVEHDALSTPAQPTLANAREILSSCGFAELPEKNT